MATFFDTHAHLDYPEFQPDLEAVLERAAAAGVTKIISIGTDFESSRRALSLAGRFPQVFAAVGWHPSYVTAAPADVRPELREMARHPKVVALGETGLDYYRLPSKVSGAAAAEDESYKRRQSELFEQHLEVAAETGLNCVIHQRDSLEDTLNQLEPFADKVRGVFHCFSGDVPTLKRILALNSLVSFTGILTFKNGQTVRDTLGATPADQFMFETDCPFLAPVPHRGKRCEPSFVKDIATLASDVRKCSLETLSEQTSATARKFFRNLG